MTSTLLAAFTVGLLGSLHCVGMCGGIVSALTLGARDGGYRLAYHAGRIFSYAVAGAVVGSAGVALMSIAGEAATIARVISALFLIALGLYIPGWWRGLAVTETAGSVLWRRLQPLGRRFLPIDRPWKALLIGSLWGWLPCGMVYVVLTGALASGGAVTGAAVMISFGLGTLPALLAVGGLAQGFANLAQHRGLRQGAGMVFMVLGFVMLLSTLIPGASTHVHHMHG